jgi:c(7)-type cytochrome triheme protein
MKNKKFIPAVLAFVCVVFMVGLILPGSSRATRKKSHEYGDILMEETTKGGAQQPVVFRHWIHRSKHSCRLCHVDIEFAMEAGDTGVIEEDNKDGRYCGACHNGKEAFKISECTKCHPKSTKEAKSQARRLKKEFFKFQKKMPRAVYGNKIDWNKAEDEGLIVVKDFLEGITFPEQSMVTNTRDEPRSPTLAGLPDIIFSHQKHVAWTGCGMCHPATFALEAGKTKITMKEITEGKFCGICHGNVAFPLNDCAKCHSKPVSH